MNISSEEQLKKWVDGESIHREIDGVKGGECCPDFSCCRPELLAAPEIRIAFRDASESDRMKFLGGFLGEAISTYAPNTKVRISGAAEPGDES